MKIKTIRVKGIRAINNVVSKDSEIFGPDASYVDISDANLDDINIFIGCNGAGKSTYLDCVRILKNPELLARLKPDVLGEKSFHGADIVFEDETFVHLEFENEGRREIVFRHFRERIHQEILDEAYLKLSGNFIHEDELKKARKFSEKLNVEVLYWRGPDQAIYDNHFLQALKNLRNDLVGLVDLNGIATAQGVLGSLELTFETVPNDRQTVSIEELPSGWKAAGGLIGWVAQAPRSSVIVIEEPETHLHPRLQRRVAQEFAKLRHNGNMQIIVATHSPIFINSSNWQFDNISEVPLAIFSVDGKSVRSLLKEASNELAIALTDLGSNVSDLLQSNVVIWVEGPSDRIYINYWLKRWSQKSGLKSQQQNIDYIFCMYGGSALSHFDAASQPTKTDAISMLRVNRNSFIVVDRDLDFDTVDGVLTKTKAKSPKYDAIDALPDSHWLTGGYTIESYLPTTYMSNGYLELNEKRLVVTDKLSKVDLARKYKKDTQSESFEDIFNPSVSSPISDIERLYRFIEAANK